MTVEDDRLKAARGLFAAIEADDVESLLNLSAQNAVQVGRPNRLKPNSDRRARVMISENH